MPENTKNNVFKSGYAAIVGRPNVGKSTLMNAFLQQKLAIVTPKAQTTRHRILGILNGQDHQIILLDTPGLIQPKYLLHESLVKAVSTAMQQADILLMMIEAGGLTDEDIYVLKALKETVCRKILVINKIDRIEKTRILPLIAQFQSESIFEEIVPVSALNGDGLQSLKSVILTHIPAGEPFYPPDRISDESERFFVSELIREKIFTLFSEEIPYAATVQIESFRENPDRKDYICAVIYVERESQKGILIGKGGASLKRVGAAARKNIEEFLDRPVFLELKVRVGKKWRKDAAMLKKLGY